MDSFIIYDEPNVVMVTDQEANSADQRDIIRLQSMGKAFRTIELCIALFFLLWVLLRLPFAVTVFGDLLRRLFLLLLTPLIVSLLFGVSAAAVMVKSYRVSTQNVADNNAAVGSHFYEHMVRNVGGETHPTTPLYEEVVYEDKEMVVTSYDCDKAKTPINASTCDSDTPGDVGTVVEKKSIDGVVLEKQLYASPRDLLNDAEFKKTVDGFIKKQRQFLKLENRYDCYGEPHVYCY